MESVKRAASCDKTETVGVRGSTEAGASSHQPRKRCRKTKVAEGSSDQPQEGGGKEEDVKRSSDQTPKRGPKAKLPPGEKEARKKERDRNRYKNMKDAADKYKEMGPQMEILKNETAKSRVELEKISSDRPPAVTQDMKTMKEDIELVKKNFKNMESLMNKFLRREAVPRQIKSLRKTNANLAFENRRLKSRFAAVARVVRATNANLKLMKEQLTDLDNRIEKFSRGELEEESFEIPWDNIYLEGEVGGMSKQEILAEFRKTREHYEELKREKEVLNSRVTDIETMIRAMTPKK